MNENKFTLIIYLYAPDKKALNYQNQSSKMNNNLELISYLQCEELHICAILYNKVEENIHHVLFDCMRQSLSNLIFFHKYSYLIWWWSCIK